MACCFGLLSKLWKPRCEGTAPEGSRCADGNFALSLEQKLLRTQARLRQLKQFLLTGRDPTVWDRDNDWFPQENYWLPWWTEQGQKAPDTRRGIKEIAADEDEGIPYLRASKALDVFGDSSRSEASPSGTDAQSDGKATGPSWDGSSLPGELRSPVGLQSTTMPIEGKILSKLPAGLLMDINRDSLGLLPWKELRKVPRRDQKIGSVLRNIEIARLDEAEDHIILKRLGQMETSHPVEVSEAPVALPVRSVLMGRKGRNGPRK